MGCPSVQEPRRDANLVYAQGQPNFSSEGLDVVEAGMDRHGFRKVSSRNSRLGKNSKYMT